MIRLVNGLLIGLFWGVPVGIFTGLLAYVEILPQWFSPEIWGLVGFSLILGLGILLELQSKKVRGNASVLGNIVVSLIFTFGLVVKGIPANISAKERAKNASVKENIHTLQTMAEIYAKQNHGQYSENLQILRANARKNGYWTEIENPWLKKQGIGREGALMDFTLTTNKTCPNKGLVLYDFDTKTHLYRIYGCGKNNNLISDYKDNLWYQEAQAH